MNFTREELVSMGRAVLDYHGMGGVEDYLGNPDVAGIWNRLDPSEQEDFTSLLVLAEFAISKASAGAAKSRKRNVASASAWRSGARLTPPEK